VILGGLVACLGAIGCESAPADPSEPEVDGGDASSIEDLLGEVGADADIRPTCATTTCPVGPLPYCDVDHANAIATETTCEDTADGPVCGLREVVTPCDDSAAGLCLLGACTTIDGGRCNWQWGENLAIMDEFRFGNHSDEIDPATGEPVDACCFDFTGDGKIDNSWSASLRALAPFLGDANEVLANQFKNGLAWNGLDVRGLDDIENDPQVDLIGLLLVPDADNDGKHPRSGEATTKVRGASFREGTTLPRISASGAIINGRFVSETARFVILLGGERARVELLFRGARIEGDVSFDENGRGIVFDGPGGGAHLGGYVVQSELFDAVNRDIADTCVCRSTGPNGEPLDPANGTCFPAADPSCEDPDPVCNLLHGPLCESFVSFYQPDFDADGDGVLDSQTSGAFFHTRQVEITGRICP
jgi:hypothetical protein